jgi:hypothetical protein
MNNIYYLKIGELRLYRKLRVKYDNIKGTKGIKNRLMYKYNISHYFIQRPTLRSILYYRYIHGFWWKGTFIIFSPKLLTLNPRPFDEAIVNGFEDFLVCSGLKRYNFLDF